MPNEPSTRVTNAAQRLAEQHSEQLREMEARIEARLSDLVDARIAAFADETAERGKF